METLQGKTKENTSPRKILVVGDGIEPLRLIQTALSQGTDSRLETVWVWNYAAGKERLLAETYQAVLIDDALGQTAWLDLLQIAAGCATPCALILLTSAGNSEAGLDALLAGADFYLLKTEFSLPLLERIMRYTAERKQAGEAPRDLQNAALEHSLAEKLRLSETRYRLAVQAVMGVVYDWDLQTNSVYQSEGLAQVVGYRPGEEPEGEGRWWPRSIHPDDRERVLAELNDAFASQRNSFAYEYRICHANGNWVTIWDQGYIVRDENGQAQRVVGVCTDITERKQAEEQRSMYAEKLSQSNKDLEQFAFVASHDLQEPLRKIKMFGNILHKQLYGQLSDQAEEYLMRMQNASARMEQMIQDLLELSRVNTRAGTFTQVDLTEVANDVLADLEPRLLGSAGYVSIDPLPSIHADALQMHQLIQNLLSNSLKFHKVGIPPVVRISGALVKSSGKEPDRVLLTIEDNGIGFEEEFAERIFQPFQRLHGRNEFEGTGMGLAICYRIVERHHGTISARTKPGEGTAFLVSLPVQQPEQ